jgi:hypothetical protein
MRFPTWVLCRSAMRGMLVSSVLGSLATWAVPVTSVAGGIFFEAEDYDGRPWYGDRGFGTRMEEPLASGRAALAGMWRPGALSYVLTVPKENDYSVWLRCAVPDDITIQLGVNAHSAADLQAVAVKATTTLKELAAPGAYQWRSLGRLALQAGENTFLLGQGAQRPDCFFLTPDTAYVPTDDLLARMLREKQAPKGQLLPELIHDRQITQHPAWLGQNALRPAYAHCEWDRSNTPQSWARMVRAAGGNCLVGVGEMPAGTLDGKMKAFAFRRIDDPGFAYPEGYRKNDHSWVREFTDAGHAEGLKVVMYGGAHRTLDPILVDHPEWRQQDAAGKVYGHGFGSWYSPYRAAYIDRWVDVARQYGIDGIMVDMLFTGPQGGDYSPFTVRAFADRFGVEPPRQVDPRDLTWQRWVDFQTWTREEVMLDVTEALHAVNPEIACIWNQTTGWIFKGREYLSSRAGRCADGLLEEMGWEVSHSIFGERPLPWPAQSAWQSLFLHCRTAPGYGQMWHLNGFYTQVNHEAFSYSMFANGIAPAVVTGGNWDHMGKVWGHIRPCESAMSGATLVPYVALHFSENTLNWQANATGPEARNAYLRSVFGVFQALLEAHLPVAIISDDDLADAAALQRHATVFLPNSTCLSDAQAASLSAYVQGGGGLVAAFETGLYDENGTRRSLPALSGLLGVTQETVKRSADWYLSARDQTHEITDVPEIMNGGDPAQGSRERKPSICFFNSRGGRAAEALRTTSVADVASIPLIGAGKGYSILHTRSAGAGRTAYFPIDIGQGYYGYNHPITRRLLERATRWSAAKPAPLRTNAPLAVQTVCFQKGEAQVVHLVNDNSSFGRAAAPNPESFGAFRDEVLPILDIAIGVPGDFAQARLLPAGQSLAIRRSEGWSHVIVPRLEIHAMVVFGP